MPIKALTDKSVPRLRHGGTGGSTTFTDTSLRALALRVRPGKDGRRTWMIIAGGRENRIRESIGEWPAMSVEAARAEVMRRLEERRTGAKAHTATVDQVVEHFKRHHRSRRKGRSPADDRDAVRRLKAISAAVGALRVAEVTTDHVRDILADLEHAPYEANRMRSQIRQLVSYAVEHEMAPATLRNPAARVATHKEAPRNRALTADEVAALLEAIKAHPSPHVRGVLLVCYELAGRIGEVMRLRWDGVSAEALTIADMKDGKARRFPMTPKVRAVIDDLRKRRTPGHEFVFEGARAGQPLRELRRPWEAICKDAGVDGVQMRDLRHARATGWLKAGGNIEAIRKALGHGDVRTTMRYLDVTDDDVRVLFES